MNKKAIDEALLIADSQSNLKHQMIVVHTIRDLCRRLSEADQVIDQRNAMLSAEWKQKREWVGLTDEERHEIREWQRIQEELGPVWAPMMLYLYIAIEAKLKEKNT